MLESIHHIVGGGNNVCLDYTLRAIPVRNSLPHSQPMKSVIRIGLFLLLVSGHAASAKKTAPAALDAYLARPEPAYGWSVAPEGQYPAGKNEVDLNLTSQTWQGIPWHHRIQIITPAEDNDSSIVPDAAMIWVGFGRGTANETLLAQSVARATGALGVNVFGVPNQPLFDKTEDALLAYSFDKAVESGDLTWPLLFPMTKAVIKAMDAVSEWSLKTRGRPINRFVIFGASKRGWTTCLVGESDNRVVGIVPIVFNFLNIPAQLAYQRKIWGATSDQMKDYKALKGHDDTPQESAVLATVDPYVLRTRLKMPKLLILATNDRYWPPDGLQFYGPELPRPWNVYYAANAQHNLDKAYIPVMFAAAGFARRILTGTPAPRVSLTAKEADGHRILDCTISGGEFLEAGVSRTAKLWYTASETPDLREAKWESVPMEPNPAGFSAELPALPGKTTYAFAELALGDSRLPLKITSSLWRTP